MKINKIKGTLDFYGKDMKQYRYIEKKAQEICKTFGFSEIMTPMFEHTEVFSRGVGETTDIVNKEMYTFLDRSENSLTLRPEGTAAISRAYVENKLYVESGLCKLSYFGPMFRCERPQAGRYRQFTQFGVEVFGKSSPYLDADVINFGYQFFQSLGINNVVISLNTIGSKESRTRYEEVLKSYFSEHIECMCQDCKNRLVKNPLRILDCKVDAKSEIMINAPKIKDYLTEEDLNYYNEVKRALDELKVPYEENDHLVRGLDYYSNTVFEFICKEPNSSVNGLAILAGGRYNSLVKELGGPDVEAIGFAGGVERMILLLNELGITTYEEELTDCVVVTIGEECKLAGLGVVNYLRKNNITAAIDYSSHNLKPQFKLSERLNAKFVIIMGSEEVNTGIVKVKNQLTKEEQNIKIDEILKIFK